MRTALVPTLLATTVLVVGCAGDGTSSTPSSTTPRDADATRAAAQPPRLRLVEVGRFEQPVLATTVPGTDVIAVLEKTGRVRLVTGMACVARDNCPKRPRTRGTVAIDLSSSVSAGGEQGLLGLAFHPRWPDDPRVFVNYTDRTGTTHVEAWNLPSATGKATRDRELLRIVQPFANHNGGGMAFDAEGLLYIGTGDGGSGGDPGDRAQTPDELLGKLLRIDVDGGGERGYAVPPGNLERDSPVWALGLRNPWRFSFDRELGDLWIGDVGQDEFEEIDAVRADQLDDQPPPNFQWRRREGFSPFEDSGRTGPGRSTPPALDYGRDDGCSVTGGYVYRGRAVQQLRGWYVFADFCSDELRLVRADGLPGSTQRRGAVEVVRRTGVEQISSFGETRDGELLVTSLAGPVYQVVDVP